MWRVWIIYFYLDSDMGNLRSNSEAHIGRFDISMNISNIVKIIESTNCLVRGRRKERENQSISHLLDYSGYCRMTKSLAWSHLTKIRKIDWENLWREGRDREREEGGEGYFESDKIEISFSSRCSHLRTMWTTLHSKKNLNILLFTLSFNLKLDQFILTFCSKIVLFANFPLLIFPSILSAT